MTVLGLLAFFGMAVVSVDVLGGILAATFLARGIRPAHLLYFVGGYSVLVLIVTILLKPLLEVASAWLAPVLGSSVALAIIQLVVGVVLVGLGAYQRYRALYPKPPKSRDVNDKLGSLAVGGALLALTTFADPTFTIAVGMAMQVHNLAYEIVLLVVWNVIYQLPLLTVTVASLFGVHTRVLAVLSRFLARNRRRLLTIAAILLVLGGVVVISDGIVALSTAHSPWLRTLLLLR